MRSLSLRSGNSPTTPYGGRVNGLQILGFPPPCHPNYRALALTPAGLSPAERASLCWTHVGSRTGAPTVGRALVRSPAPITFPAPASQTQHAVFPPTLSCLSRQGLKPSPSHLSPHSSSAPFSSRLFPCRQSRYRQQGVPPARLHRYYQPLRHPLACQPISRGCRLYGLPLLRRFLNGARRASPVA